MYLGDGVGQKEARGRSGRGVEWIRLKGLFAKQVTWETS